MQPEKAQISVTLSEDEWRAVLACIHGAVKLASSMPDGDYRESAKAVATLFLAQAKLVKELIAAKALRPEAASLIPPVDVMRTLQVCVDGIERH